MKMARLALFVVTIGLPLCLALTACGCEPPLTTKSPPGGDRAGAAVADAQSAESLATAFLTDDRAAIKYFNKTVVVRGVVEEVDAGRADYSYVTLQGARKPGAVKSTLVVNFRFAKNSPSAKTVPSLKTGQEVTIRGTFDDLLLDGLIVVNCELLDPAPNG